MPRRKKAKSKKKMEDNSEGTSVDIEPVKKDSEPVDKEIEIDKEIEKEEKTTEVELKIVEDSDLVENGDINVKKVEDVDNLEKDVVDNGGEKVHPNTDNISESGGERTNGKDGENGTNGHIEETPENSDDKRDVDHKIEDIQGSEHSSDNHDTNENVSEEEEKGVEISRSSDNKESIEQNNHEKSDSTDKSADTDDRSDMINGISAKLDNESNSDTIDQSDTVPKKVSCDDDGSALREQQEKCENEDVEENSRMDASQIQREHAGYKKEENLANVVSAEAEECDLVKSAVAEEFDLVKSAEAEECDLVKSADVDSFITSVCEEINKEMKDIEKELTVVEEDKELETKPNTVEDKENEGKIDGNSESENKFVGDKENVDKVVDLENEEKVVKDKENENKIVGDIENENKAVSSLPSETTGRIQQECATKCDVEDIVIGDIKKDTETAEKEKADDSEKDKQLTQLTSENMVLREELREARAAIHTSQKHVHEQQVRHNQMMMSLKLQLYKGQATLKQQQNKSDQQMSEVMSHLLMLEGRLKREQCRVKRELKLKNETIESQKIEILKLREQNDQLLNAIKEFCAKGGMNGYMRDKKKGLSTADNSDGSKSGKEKKLHNGKLNTVKDKFSWKNRSSLELNHFDPEKYLIKNARMYSSHEELNKIGHSSEARARSNFIDRSSRSPLRSESDVRERHFGSPGSFNNGDFKRSPRNSQNYFSDDASPKQELSTSVSESSQLSEHSSTSGFHSLSDQDLSNPDISMVSGHHGNTKSNTFDDDDDDDDCYFSFSSTRINTVIDEEEAIGQSGQMLSMGSMPLLSSIHDDQKRLSTNKDRPHSLSSVDLISIQQQAENLSNLHMANAQSEMSTPPSSPSFSQKNEMTPFQTFKTMFKRKGSKNKGKKRSVSLSQTTTKEYTEAMKKHFQKYDMN